VSHGRGQAMAIQMIATLSAADGISKMTVPHTMLGR
jgi:hypothetical protein